MAGGADKIDVIVKEMNDEKDAKRQICRVSAKVAEQCSLSLGQCVRFRTPFTTVICRVFPSIESEAYVCYNSCVTENSDNSLSDQLAVKLQRLDIHCLNCSDGKEVSVKVIVKDISKYRSASGACNRKAELSSQCVHCLRGLHVTPGCSVDLSNSRLAKLYGIVLCNVLSCSSDTGPPLADSQSAFRITQDTSISISDVQSLECYQLVSQAPKEKKIDIVGGLQEEQELLADLLRLPSHLSTSQGVLLHGPPGCGKTSLVRQVAQECGAALVVINGPEVLSSNPGESESNLAATFGKAGRLSHEVPCILFIDEVDSICPRQGNANSARVSTALLTQLDKASGRNGLLVVMATNRPAALDPALRRPGRLDTEVGVSTFFFFF